MKKVNINKYIIGKKKLGKGKVGHKGGVGVPTGAFGNGRKCFKKQDENNK